MAKKEISLLLYVFIFSLFGDCSVKIAPSLPVGISEGMNGLKAWALEQRGTELRREVILSAAFTDQFFFMHWYTK